MTAEIIATKREKPILFNGDMVRAILDERKTKTRRLVKGLALDWLENEKFTPDFVALPENDMCPFGKVGDQLWVRETWAIASKATDLVKVYYEASSRQSHTEFHEYFPVELAGDMLPTYPKSRPSIHMPRWASRIQLEITNIRVERLQDISEDDVVAEGIDIDALLAAQDSYDIIADQNFTGRPTLLTAWRKLWESTGGDWDTNPWVWVIEFKRVGVTA